MTSDEKIAKAHADALADPTLDAAHRLAMMYVDERAEAVAVSYAAGGFDVSPNDARLIGAMELLAHLFRAEVEPAPRLRLVPKDDA